MGLTFAIIGFTIWPDVPKIQLLNYTIKNRPAVLYCMCDIILFCLVHVPPNFVHVHVHVCTCMYMYLLEGYNILQCITICHPFLFQLGSEQIQRVSDVQPALCDVL